MNIQALAGETGSGESGYGKNCSQNTESTISDKDGKRTKTVTYSCGTRLQSKFCKTGTEEYEPYFNGWNRTNANVCETNCP